MTQGLLSQSPLNAHNIELFQALLWSEKNHVLVQISNPDIRLSAQTIVLGMDFDNCELLLGDLMPQPSPETWARLLNGYHWLKLKIGQRYLFVKIFILEQSRQSLSVKWLEAFFSDNQRWHSRVHFPSRQGPEVDIIPNHSQRLTCWLKNLSRGGGALEIFGPRYQGLFKNGERHTATFSFNNHYCPSLKLHIIESSSKRTPCCHDLLRFKFYDLNPVNAAQLTEFVNIFHVHEHVA